MDTPHDISQLILWYQRIGNIPAKPIEFVEMLQFADELNLLQDCFQKPGTISVIHPSTFEPNLSILHRSITASSNSIFAMRFIFHHPVRKFYINFSLQEVETITEQKTAKLTLIELLVVLSRMLQSQEMNVDYPDIYEQDLPYRSRSWVLSLIQYLESDYIGRMCVSEDFKRLNNIVGRFMEIIDFYEVSLQAMEMRFLNNLDD
jgi:hypothetical protein